MDRFLRRWADSYLHRIAQANQAMIWRNNWQSHRIKLLTLIAVATDDSRLSNRSRALFRQQIAQNIDNAGVTLDFKDRDALHYVVYDLQQLVDAALAARHRG
ncbi:alginate lyase family protein [Sodalis glossinidius]|uniref:alginate lyase family protein n=1 Tax=Sodalis glossinidius TaxID=63612 RepID=UPI0002E284B7|nr:alginate lyase family protein [Sodalis glossinidius]